MQTKSILLLVVLLLLLLAIVLIVLKNYQKEKQARVCFNESCFNVQIANTSEQRSRGLMFQESMPFDQGMLFVFDQEKKHSFWMKNTLIPLDIIWLDAGRQVVFIKENAQPCQQEPCPNIEPTEEAKYVLELNAGAVKAIGLTFGNTMRLETQQTIDISE